MLSLCVRVASYIEECTISRRACIFYKYHRAPGLVIFLLNIVKKKISLQSIDQQGKSLIGHRHLCNPCRRSLRSLL